MLNSRTYMVKTCKRAFALCQDFIPIPFSLTAGHPSGMSRSTTETASAIPGARLIRSLPELENNWRRRKFIIVPYLRGRSYLADNN